ncbi:MAG: PIN domain-containing protein [Xanthobacteraceae bacterium]|nr:PIN domain-containing protein [Xanthobacteraceae bacterium]
MILVDVNILLYATNSTVSQHAAARKWLDRQLSDVRRVGLPWPSLLGFLRLATSARVAKHPLTMNSAWNQVLQWLDCEPVWIPSPTDQHGEVLGKLLAEPGALGNLVPDAHLAALAIEHGLTLCSTDGDFARFPDLKLLNPLSR